MKWKDAVLNTAIIEVAKKPAFQKKSGEPHLKSIQKYLGLDYQTVK